jgi:hypothetical protein
MDSTFDAGLPLRPDDLNPRAIARRESEFADISEPAIELLKPRLGKNFVEINTAKPIYDVYANAVDNRPADQPQRHA